MLKIKFAKGAKYNGIPICNSNAVDRRRPFVGLSKTLFLEQAGSVKNYVEENGVIKGNRLDYEYIQDVEPTYEPKCIQKIQSGALDFVQRFANRNINLPVENLFKRLKETGLRPTTKKDLELFAVLDFLMREKRSVWLNLKVYSDISCILRNLKTE